MEFDVICSGGIKHQAADGLSRLPTSGDNSNRSDDAVPVMSVRSLLNDEGKRRIKPNEVINDNSNWAILPAPLDHPLYAKLRHQRWRQPKQG